MVEPSGSYSSLKSYFALSPVLSKTGRLNCEVRISAKPSIVVSFAQTLNRPGSIIVDHPPRPAGKTGQPSGPNVGLTEPCGGPLGSGCSFGSSRGGSDSFNFGPFFPSTISYTGISLVSR